MRNHPVRERLILAGLLLAVFAWRAQRSDQPILENYVGRQVPTAMVARNLTRGSGFLSPQLDTGPFPNLFLVEPPITAQLAAWVARPPGLPLGAAGRLVSALATTLAAWGLFGLVRRRESCLAALAAVVCLGAFPVTIRYGRAFQPDALTMGLVVAGLRCWDEPDNPRWALAGWFLLAIGLAQKVTWAFVLVPLWLAISRPETNPGRIRRRIMALLVILPALAWYGVAALRVAEGGGAASSASEDNAANWLARLAPRSYLEAGRYGVAARDLFARSFTPLGIVLVAFGMVGRRSGDRLWRIWTLAALGMLTLLFGKLHHDYYWLMLAPPFAAWAGIGVDQLARVRDQTANGERLSGRSCVVAVVCLAGLVGLGLMQTRSTWRTPDAWRAAPILADAIRRLVPPDGLVIAPEAVLYLGDRRGCRLEYDARGARRAANEWRPMPPYTEDDPTMLVSFYRRQAGARYFANLDAAENSPAERRLNESVRRDPSARILDDRPGGYLLVEFVGPPTLKDDRP